MTKPTSNLTNSNVSILSNSNEKASKLQNRFKEQAKLDIFKTLDFDKRKFTYINDTISEIKESEKNTTKSIDYYKPKTITYEELKTKKPFDSIFEKYKNADKNGKELMYMEIAERIILDRKGVVEYSSKDAIGGHQVTEDFVRNEYDTLNNETKYKNRLDFFTVEDKEGQLFIIRWKPEELAKITQRESELKDEEIKKLQEEKGNHEERIARLEERLFGSENDISGKISNEEADDENEIDDKQDTIEESETLDVNLNYISRSSVERQVSKIRGAEGYPKGTIKIKNKIINIEEFEFYEEFKQEYIEAKGDTTRLSRLDKEFAEMIILFSPKGADYNNKYCIKLSEAELKDGLYVSEERLARYGVMINISDYTEKVIEREIIRERKIIRKIETVITELQTSIVELTRTISIEKSSSTVILEEIKRKRELLAILIKKQKILLASLKGLDNDEELKKLREEEARLQKEYEALQKEKEKQNKLKKEIDEIKKKIAELEGNDDKSKLKDTIDGKKKGADEIRDEIKNLEKERDSYKWRLENGTITADEIVTLKSKIEKLNKKIDKLKSELKKLEDEIKELESQLEGDDEIAKLEKEITNKKTEKTKLQKRLSKLVAEKSLYETGRTNDETYADNERRNAEIEEIEKKLKIINKEIEELETKKEELENGGKDSEELKKLIKRLAELEGQLDPDIDEKLEEKEQELENIKKQIEEKEQSGDKGELEAQLIAIIEEQKNLLAELESLEALLTTAKTKEEKIKIEEEIRIINERLTIISQKITEFESFIQIYKSRVTIKKYKIFQIIPNDPTPVPNKPFEMTSVISDMGTDVFKEKAALKVEEELKRQYAGLGRWQIGSRLALFLGRGSKRKKMMKNEMNNMANTAFQTNAAYTTLNEQSQNAADRHGHELLTNMAAVNRITTVHNPQVDQLCKDYLNGRETDATFQTKFNAIVAADANIQNALRGQNITHIGTNILLQLKEQKALKDLIKRLDSELSLYINGGQNPVYKDNMENFVEQYIRDYQKTPAFMAIFEPFIKSGIDSNKSLEKYLRSQQTIMKMQITNLTMNIDIVNKGKSAYQIDNKDREKGWKYRLGHKLDKHPRGTAIGSVALAVGLGAVTAGTSAVLGAAVTTGVFGSYVGFTNYIKKWTHHTKEQNTHEKNVVTDYRNEQAKIQNWQNLALNGHGRKKYKAKRQLALYDQTTQENIQLSNQISEYITNLSAKIGTLSDDEKNFMRLNLIEGWARLKYYRAMGHNFLASENVDKTEEDMKRLEKAITLGLEKLSTSSGSTLTANDIETTMTATNGLGTNITYNVIQNDLKASYDKSLIQFKRERRNLALKYGIGTAVASIGTSLAFQYAFGTGVFSHESAAYNASRATADYYDLGRSNGLTGNIAADTNSALSSAPNGATVTIGYGAGTDATPVIPGHLNLSELTGAGGKIDTVKTYINGLPTKLAGAPGPGLTVADKATFIAELNSMGAGSGTNGVLQSMRECNLLQQAAKGLSDSGKSGLVNVALTPDPALDVIGTTTHTAGDRVANAFIEITKDGVPGKKCWFFGVPLFFNTFKDRKANKNETTDQNFGSNAQGNQQPRNP